MPLPSSEIDSRMWSPSCSADSTTRPVRALPEASRSSGISTPWSTALRTRCTNGSARASTRFLSRSVSSPTSSRLISFLSWRARSRTRRGKRPNTFLIGCMRVFITAVCRSAVTTSRLDTALDMASSPLFRPRRTRRLRTSTSSPTMFMISSRRAVSTRTVVSASLAPCLSAAGAGARGAAAGLLAGAGAGAAAAGLATGWLSALAATGACTLAAAGASTAATSPPNLPLPCNWSSSASNSCSLISSLAALVSVAAGAGALAAGKASAWKVPLPCNWSSSDSNSASVISSLAASGALATGCAATSALNWPLPCNWSSSDSNSASLISSPSPLTVSPCICSSAAACALTASSESSSCSNSLSVMSCSSAGASATGAGAAAAGTSTASAPPGSARRDSAASSSGVAAVTSVRSRTWPNMLLTVSSASSTTSISSASTRRSPLRRTSNTFSAIWQHSTSSFS
ncbi:hypothetical protein D3C81_954280 [compost metagenome]